MGSFQVCPHQINHVLCEFMRIRSRFFGRKKVKPDVVFQYFGHKAVDSAPNICEEHKNVRAVVPAR